MSDAVNVRKNYATLEKQEQFDGYSKVVIVVDEDANIQYTAGSETGRTLTLTCPFGTQEMAENILEKVKGYQYQPYSATGAHIDPAAEIGDGITVGGIYGGLFTKDVTHGPLYTADVSAPGGEKINYAYPYKTIQRRKIERNFRDVSATFKVQGDMISQEVEERKAQGETFKAQFQVQAGQISAKVEKTNTNYSSFGWQLTDTYWQLFSNNSTILKATKDGLEVKGKITATSGKIGGFDIQSNYLSYNGQTYGGTNTYGAYIGTSGIQLGKNFKVDMAGNLYAYSGTFDGTVYAGNIQYGGSAGYLSGSGLSSYSVTGTQVAGSTLSTAKFTSGVNSSLAHADYAYDVFSGIQTASSVLCYNLTASTKASVASLYIGGTAVTTKSVTFTDGSGTSRTIAYWGWG